MEHENLRVFPNELSTLPKIITQSQFQLSPFPPCSCSNYSQCISKCWLKVSWHSIYFGARHAHTKSSYLPLPPRLHFILLFLTYSSPAGTCSHFPYSILHFPFLAPFRAWNLCKMLITFRSIMGKEEAEGQSAKRGSLMHGGVSLPHSLCLPPPLTHNL